MSERVDSLPYLLFSADGSLSEERGVLEKKPGGIRDCGQLCARFLRSLGGDRDAFLAFCAADRTDDVYRLYSLFRFPAFGFAFCEKTVIRQSPLTIVFLSDRVSDFHVCMTPAATTFRSAADQILYELFTLTDRDSEETPRDQLTPEAFLVYAEVPYLVDAMLKPRCASRYCDLPLLTDAVLDRMKRFPAYEDLKVETLLRSSAYRTAQSADPDNPFAREAAHILEFPVEAYAFLLYVCTAVLASVSADRSLCLTLYHQTSAAEVRLSAAVRPIPGFPGGLCSLHALAGLNGLPDSLVRVAAVTADLSGLAVSVRYDPVSGVLTFYLILGLDLQSKPDYKFSDPYAAASPIVLEGERLRRLLGG